MGKIVPRGWDSNINGKEIVVWGTGKDAPGTVETLRNVYGMEVSFFVSGDHKKNPSYMDKKVLGKDSLDKEKHYVVIGSRRYVADIQNELSRLGFELNRNFAAFAMTGPDIGEIRNDRRHNGVFVGKYSYFPGTWGVYMVDPDHGGIEVGHNMVSYIGRFTSINGTAQIHADHLTLNISTSPFVSGLIEKSKREGLINARGGMPKENRVRIGNDVWIGANVFINASKVGEIGDGAIIGSGAVVIDDVPPYAVVVGVPGRVKKYRYTPEQIECLLRVKWWDWSDGEIDKNAELLYNPDMFFERFM